MEGSARWCRQLGVIAGVQPLGAEGKTVLCFVVEETPAGIRIADIEATLPGLPDPDAVFIGGGLSIPDLIDTVWRRLTPGGTLVANAVTLEGETVLAGAYARFGGTLSRIAVSHASPVGNLTGWRPAMAVTQWTVTKP